MIVLDANVISELMSATPSERVRRWAAGRSPASLFTTSVTQAEILFGLRLMPKGKRRENLEAAADDLFDRVFAGRLLAFGQDAARAYARIAAERTRRGRPISTLDAQIAAIARTHGGALATRNVDDFEACGIDVIDPWTE